MQSRAFRFLLAALVFVVLIVAAVFATYYDDLRRLTQVATLFDEGKIADNFRSMDIVLQSATVEAGGDV